jgi:hypothetical protein
MSEAAMLDGMEVEESLCHPCQHQQDADTAQTTSKGAKGKGKGKSSPMMCKVCKNTNAKKKQLYCEECLKDVAGCKKDAEENGWLAKYEEAAKNEGAFQALILQYRLECPSFGRGKKRANLDYHRYFKSTYHDQQARRGTKETFMDWGQFEKWMTEERGFEATEAAKQWKEIADNATESDDLGRKGMEKRYPVTLEKYIIREHVHGVMSGKEQSSKLNKKRGRDSDSEEEFNGMDHDFGSSHFNQKAARLASGQRGPVSGTARLLCVLVQ